MPTQNPQEQPEPPRLDDQSSEGAKTQPPKPPEQTEPITDEYDEFPFPAPGGPIF